VNAEATIMKNIKFEISQPELSLLITLLSDQLFRREFIDPKMPGYKGDPAELTMGKELVLRLKSLIREATEIAKPIDVEPQSQPRRRILNADPKASSRL
jgi:hypothetical protein